MHALLTSERERGYPCTGKHVQATQLPRPPPRQPSSSPAFLMAATSIFSAGCPSSELAQPRAVLLALVVLDEHAERRHILELYKPAPRPRAARLLPDAPLHAGAPGP